MIDVSILSEKKAVRLPSYNWPSLCYSGQIRCREIQMAQSTRTRPTHSVLPARPPLLTPHPAAAPLLPPLHVVDLMTAEGSAAFAATWRVREAKLVECPALGDAMPEFPTTYDIEPHAEERGFDDSDWIVVPATDLGGRRGGGMVSFC